MRQRRFRLEREPGKRRIHLIFGENFIADQNEKEVSRRSFAQLLAMTGLAALGAAIVVIYRGRTKTYPALVVAQAGEIPVGGSKIFTYPTDIEPCILLRSSGDTYVAFSRTCTHASCPLHYQPADNRLDCPCHGGAFSAADGSVIFGPPPRPLPRIILERRGQDLVATGIVKS